MSIENNMDDTPANTDAGTGNNNRDTSALHLHDSTLHTGQEYQADKNADHRDDEITASGVDDLHFNSDGATGTDRAGTTERKSYGDTKLNPGLNEQ